MKKEILALTIVFLLLSTILYKVLDSSYNAQISSILNKEQKQLQISYNATSNMYNIILNNIVHQQLLRIDVIDILTSVYGATNKEILSLRGKLYRKLWKIYDHELIPLNIKQLQFHLKDGKSFLCFSNPAKSGDNLFDLRKTIRVANIDKVIASGFEGGRISPGFRHVYPIVHEGKHLGSVELSLSFEALKIQISKLLPYMNFNFIIKRYISTDMVDKENIERFSSVKFSDEYVTENPYILKLTKDNKSIMMMDKISKHVAKSEKNSQQITEKLKQGKQFFTIINNGKSIHVAHFLPIYDTNNKLAAYIIGSDQREDLKSIQNQKITYQTLGIAGIFTLLVLLFLHFKNIKKTVDQKNEIQTIAKTLKSGLMVIDKKGVVSFINDAACEMLGYEIDELLHKIIHKKVHYHPSHESKCPIINVGIDGNPYRGEEKFIKKGGDIFPAHVSCSPLIAKDEIIGTVTVFRDISEEKTNEDKIKKLAYYDFLTSLPNRKLFFDRLERAIIKSKRRNYYGGFIYIDLDDFKNVNDTYGHKAGDDLLIQVSHRLSAHVRKEDTIARMGGDEFTIIIDVLSSDGDKAHEILTLITSKIHKAFHEPFIIDEKSYECKVSIGGLVFKNSKDITANMIMEKADLTMYEAKKEGKNRYKIYTLDV